MAASLGDGNALSLQEAGRIASAALMTAPKHPDEATLKALINGSFQDHDPGPFEPVKGVS